MAVDYNELSSKQDNYDGKQGQLTANEWNEFVKSVKSHDDSIRSLSSAKIEGVRFNGQAYTDIVTVQAANGKSYRCIDVPADSSARTVKFNWLGDNDEPTNITVAANTSIPLKYQMYDVDINSNPFIGKGIVNVYVDDNKVYTIVNIGHGDTVSFDLAKVAGNKLSSSGIHTVKIEYDNSNKTESKYIAVEVISLSLEFDNFNNFYTTTSTSWPVAYLTTGSVLHYTISNPNAATITGSSVADWSSMPLEDIIKLSKHGVNNITFWSSIEKDGVIIKTDEQHFKYAYVSNTNEVIIMSNILNGDSFDLYNNINVGFTAYIPNLASGKKDIKVGLYNNDTLVFNETTISIDVVGNVGYGNVSFSLVPDGNFNEATVLGINKIRIVVDGYIDETTIKINKVAVSYHEVPGYEVYFNADNNSNQISHDWVSTGKHEPISMKFDNVPFIDGASGWYTDATNGTSLKLKRGSYCTLDYKPFETNPAYNNVGNSGLTISIEFATSNCFKDNASVIKCLDPDTGYGFEVTASNAMLKSSNKTLYAKFKENTRLRLDFVIEGKLTEYTQKSWVPTNPEKPSEGQQIANSPSNEAMMLMYIDGVYVGLAEYGTTKGTDFRQQTPQSIVFGSDLCDIDIYKIRIYKDALNCVEIVNNYAYDANGVSNKTAIALRNDIFGDAQGKKRNKPDIDLIKLRTARPDLPIVTVRLDDKHHNSNIDPALRGELTNNKKDWQLCSLSEFANPGVSIKAKDIALNSWQANTGTIRNQGTSSMGYPWPWRNWDWKTGDEDHGTSKDNMLFYFPTLDSSETSKKWAQYQYKWDPKSTLMKKLTFKKDYASSEMCNNAICSELFTDFATMLATSKSDYIDSLLTKKMAAEWKSTYDEETSNGVVTNVKNSTDYRFSLKAKPCFMVQELSYNPNGGDPGNINGTAGRGKDALGMMNLIPNKNEVYYLGFSKNRWEDNDWVETNGRVWIKNTNENGEEIEIVEDREQAWELRENKDGVYWRYHIDPAHMENGEFKNEIFDHYEARTPKDSPIFDDTDFGDIDSKSFNADKHIDAMKDQTKDICRLHNWFVDTNRELATGKKIKELYSADTYAALKSRYGYSDEWDERYDLKDNGPDTNGNTYESWRLLRFKTEAKDYLIEKQWIMYYLWRELFWMFDSGFKNLQVYTVSENPNNPNDPEENPEMLWGVMVRDADTALGIENTGKDYFAPHLEDVDGYKVVDGVTQYGYDIAKGLYHSSELTNIGYSPVLNGQFGSVWVNIRDAWKDDVAGMFNDLKNAGLSTNFVTNKFRNHQENWCEALYNFGMRQYFAGDAYLNNISAGLGDKKHSRAQWLERGMYYRTSKYKAFDTDDYMYCRRAKQHQLYVKDLSTGGERVALPIDEQTNITIKSYIPQYIYCGGDQLSTTNNAFRLIDKDNDKNYSVVINVISKDGMYLTDSEDTNTTVYGTRYITDMGELFKYCRLTTNPQTLNMPMLRSLEFGHDYRRDNKQYYTLINGEYRELENINTKVQTIPLSSMVGLSILDVTNHRALSTLDGLDSCKQLEELYISGTSIQTLNLPQTSTIKKLYLNDKLSNITFDNLINLEDVRIAGYNNVTSVYITNCNEYMQTKSAEIITNCIDNLVKNYDGITNNCTLTNINWTSFGNNAIGTHDYEILEKLVDINADIKGSIYVSKMTPSLKIKLINKYGDVDKSTNSLFITYPSKYIDSVKFNRTEYYLEPGQSTFNFSNELTFNPTDANSMINTSWALDNATNVSIDPVTGVITRKNNDEHETPVIVTATITQNVPAIGIDPIKTTTTVLYLKTHIAKPGDVVYADGSFSSEIVEAATPIGICFYVDTDNHKNRLMFALEYATQSSVSWGMGKYYSSAPNSERTSPLGFDESMYNISDLNDYNDLGINIESDTSVFDTNYILNNAFNTQMVGALKEIGFKQADKDVNVISSYADKDKPNKYITKNSVVPFGLYNTLSIINKRNEYLIGKVSSEYNFANLDYINVDDIIPHTTKTTTEQMMLTDNINVVINKPVVGTEGIIGDDTFKASTANMDLYYPAASYCWAYSPAYNKSIDNLNSMFGEHNWFLPTAGDAYRIAFYLHCLYTDKTDKLNKYGELTSNFIKFKNLDSKSELYKKLNNINNIISCTEFNISTGIVGVVKANRSLTPSGSLTSTYVSSFKGNATTSNILPICKF